jgi:hypothetical protein
LIGSSKIHDARRNSYLEICWKGKNKIPNLEIIILTSIIVLAAFTLRGLTGFGSGLFMVPILLLFLDMKLVVPTSATFTMLCGFILLTTFQTRKWIRKDVLPMLIGGAIIGTIAGTYVLTSFKSDSLKKLFGVFIIAYALKMLLWNRTNDKEPKNFIGIIAGFFGGLLGGLFSTGGPPVVIYLNKKTCDRRIFRATIIFYFLVVNSWQFAVYCYTGLITLNVLKFILCLLPAFVLGNLIGSFLHVKINDVLFNRIVGVVLLITGTSNLF